MLCAVALVSLAACDPAAVTEAPVTQPTWEQFLEGVEQEPGTGLYIYDGDVPVASLEELQAIYARLFAPLSPRELGTHRQNLAVAPRPDSGNERWSDTDKKRLTSCVGTAFGSRYPLVVEAMAQATAAWERIADVDFTHLAAEDARCDNANANVLFDVNPAPVVDEFFGFGPPLYNARAFFPSWERRRRNIYVNFERHGYLAIDETLTGLMRHELGHVLGFAHEAMRPEAWTRCHAPEGSLWRAITAYDPGSVMHFPECGSTNLTFRISATDAEGAASVYGAPSNGFAKNYPSMFLRGTFNAWKTVNMELVADHLWQTDVFLTAGEAAVKFDASGDWTVAFGASDQPGRAALAGPDILVSHSPARYVLRFNDATLAYSVEPVAESSWRRTVVFIYGTTQPGQDMFIRGGIDHGYAQSALGLQCTDGNYLCAVPIRHLNPRNATTSGWKNCDTVLDWYGPQLRQSEEAEGTALDWTTNEWNSSWGAAREVELDGFGESELNGWGDHHWMLDVEMDCSKTVDGWFEVKSFISNGPGWESDVRQPGAPYVSGNHFARCGMVSMFRRNESAAVFQEL